MGNAWVMRRHARTIRSVYGCTISRQSILGTSRMGFVSRGIAPWRLIQYGSSESYARNHLVPRLLYSQILYR